MTEEKKTDISNLPEEAVEQVKRGRGRPKGSRNGNYEYKQKRADREKAIKALWKRGILKWKLDTNQQEFYNLYHTTTSTTIVAMYSRQIGKTYMVTAIIAEDLMAHPDWVMAYVAPKKSQAKKITHQSINDIFKDAPEKYRPTYNTVDSYWEFYGGGKLYIAGTDNGNVETIRGSTFNRVFVDEFCFLDDFDYCLQSVIFPTMTSIDDKLLVMISSPPKTFDHPSNKWIDRAEEQGTLITKTIYDCPRMTTYKIEEMAKLQYGSTRSPDFRREYMVERIPDINSLVIPEASLDKMDELTVEHYDYPLLFNAVVSADWGVMDNNFILFAYYDFKNNKIVIDNELELSGVNQTTQGISEEIKKMEESIWDEDVQRMRYCDNNLQLINDLNMTYNMQFLATAKDNLQAAVNAVRAKVQNNEIVIKDRCKILISQMKSASWDRSRKKFKKAKDHHYDGVAALVYLVRNINTYTNPFPPGYDVPGDSFISNKYTKLLKEAKESKLSKIFTFNRKKK